MLVKQEKLQKEGLALGSAFVQEKVRIMDVSTSLTVALVC